MSYSKFKIQNSKLLSHQSGFSLLEMVVAMSLFIGAMLLATGIFQQVANSQHATIASQNTQESLKYAFEVMSKEMRTAVGNNNGSDCSAIESVKGHFKTFNGSDNAGETQTENLYFKNQNGECVSYKLEDGRIKIGRKKDADEYNMFMTPVSIEITDLKFNIQDEPADVFYAIQPRITMRLDANSKNGKVESKESITLQTVVSSRYYKY
jgi:prepilin-type N-terminal cleavage/methylation domain-containing protein